MEDIKVEVDETNQLIASNKVEGTAVYNRDGDRLGSVYNFMVDKHSGKVEYVVMSFGGLLGLNEKHHPLPWDQLTYDTDRGGYVVNLSTEQLASAPSYLAGEEPTFDRSYSEQVYGYYTGETG